eukprot:3935708-Rhodomonas_salina.2
MGPGDRGADTVSMCMVTKPRSSALPKKLGSLILSVSRAVHDTDHPEQPPASPSCCTSRHALMHAQGRRPKCLGLFSTNLLHSVHKAAVITYFCIRIS